MIVILCRLIVQTQQKDMGHTLEVQMSVVKLIACMSFILRETVSKFGENSFIVFLHVVDPQLHY